MEVDEVQIRKDVFNEMVENMLLKQEAENAGIFVSNEQILDIMLDNPPDFLKKNFMDSTGVFNKQVYLDIITNPNKLRDYLASSMTPEQIEEQIFNFKKDLIMIEGFLREQKLTESMTALVSTTETILSNSFLEQKYLAKNSKTGVKYLFFDVNTISDNEVNVSMDELKKRYDETKQYYEQKPVRRVTYVAFPLIPSQDDTIRAFKKVGRILEDLANGSTLEERDSIFEIKLSEYGGTTSDFMMAADIDQLLSSIIDSLGKLQVVGPVQMGPGGTSFFRLDDRRTGENIMAKASHILISFNDNKDSAKAEANSIFKKTKTGDFAKLAEEFSQDPGSAKNGGDLGFFGKGRMVKEFEDAVFAANIGSIVGPVESQFGYHIIKVVDKKSEEIKYSEINIKPVISNTTTNQIFRQAYSIQKQSEEGTSFDTLVARLNLTPASTHFVKIEEPILGSQYLTHLAFNSEIGTVFEPIELKQYGVVVAALADARQGGVMPYSDLEPVLKQELMHRKKLDLLEKKANSFYKNISSATDLMSIPQNDPAIQVRVIDEFFPDMNIPGIGVDVGFATEAFKLPQGKINKPVRGSRGYYIIQTYGRNIPDVKNMKAELYSFRTDLQRDARQRAYFQWFGKLKETAVIEDFRHKFYKDY